MIPGLGTDVSEYHRIVDPLARGCKVLALDNRGAGRTDKPNMPYTIEMMADDAAGLMMAVGFGQASILGTSLGSCAAGHGFLLFKGHEVVVDAVEAFIQPRGGR